MILDALLFIIIAVLAWLLVVRIKIIRESTLNKKTLLALYVLNLLGSITYYCIINVRFYGGDSHMLFVETSTLIKNNSPLSLLKLVIFDWSNFNLNENLFSTHNSKTWTDIGRQLHFKFNLLCNVITGSREFANAAIYGFIFFIGRIALFRAFYHQYTSRKLLIIFATFFIPSVWFWCSGMHKDGFVLCFISLALYQYSKVITQGIAKRWWLYWLFILLAIAMRYNIAIGLLPCAALLHIAHALRKKYSARLVFTIGIIAYAILFFSISSLVPALNPMQVICNKQKEFYGLEGRSQLPKFKLEPTITSFIKNAPIALNHVLCRPYPNEIKDSAYAISALETYMLTLIMITLLCIGRMPQRSQAMIQFCIYLTIILYLVIGYIVPFHGAFIRYRSIYLPLINAALLCTVRLPERIANMLQKWEVKYL